MSDIDHDLQEEYEILLMDYACGRLNNAQRILVASCLALSEQARRQIHLLECLGGALMEQECEPVSMREESLSSVLAQLECCEQNTGCEPYVPRHRIKTPMPQPLCREISVRCGGSASWRTVWPGIRILRIPSDEENCTMHLMHMNPGARLPRHSHTAREITLVLDGLFMDVSGIHKRGDILIMDSAAVHAPQADAQKGCTCLIINESQRGVIPIHWLARLVGRF